MKTILLPLLAAVLLTVGCAGDAKSKQREQQAFIRGQMQSLAAQQEAQQPVVWFRGPVRNPRIPWTEDLTLARALAAAEYTPTLNPRTLKVLRKGQTFIIDIKRLLRGLEDPPLEAGDLIEITR